MSIPGTELDPAMVGFFARGGEMGERMRSFDWSHTALGPVEHWPPSLRVSVGICINSRFPMILWWGPELTVLYNDPYIPILGHKHPHASLGLPGEQVWHEVWPVVGPLLKQVMEEGDATWADDLQLFLNRSGYPEETYFRFSYSPIRDETGCVAGVFTPVSETTRKVLAERRLSTLKDLADCGNLAQSAAEAREALLEVLGHNPFDIPFAVLYVSDEEHKTMRLTAAAGVAAGSDVSPLTISVVNEAGSPLEIAMQEVIEHGQLVEIDRSSRLGTLPPGPWGDPPAGLVAVPVRQPGHSASDSVLVAGISARKRLDEDYRSFFELVAQQIGTALSSVRAYEEERRRAEALAELDQVKTAFFSNVSHEFRTPLTLMLGPLDAALRRAAELPPDVADELAMVRRNALRLQRMVNALLDFSRIEAGRIRAQYEPTDLAAATADLASTFRSAMESAGLEYRVETDSFAEPVWVDREMWEKVVLNLISNAFKFTFHGSVKLQLRKRDSKAELTVQDTGTGIPEADLPHVFERFHRVAGAQGRTQEGTGIGLALVAELVKLHGGTIAAQSRLGQGSIFTVFLPLGKAHLNGSQIKEGGARAFELTQAQTYLEESAFWQMSRQTQPAGKSIAPGEAEPLGGRILLADDNADMREYLRNLLTPRYEVVTAANGEEALRIANENPPDLVLSDVMMPRMDGFQLLRALREGSATKNLPVILLSARAGEESISESMEAGADDYLVKPFGARELLARVGAHIELSRARRLAASREEQLRNEAEAARDRVVAILESINDGFISMDSRWRFTYVNAAAEELLGSSRDEILGRDHWEYFPGTLGTHLESEYRRAASERTTTEFENLYAPWNRWFLNKVYPTADGGLSIYFRDITTSKKAEEALRESERRFRELADNISQFAWMAHPDGSVYWFNRRWYDYTGTTFEEVGGWGWQKLHHPEHVDRVMNGFKRAFESGQVWEDTFPLRGRSGDWRWFLSRARPIRDDDGGIVRWFGTNTDVTAQLEIERDLRRANQDLEQFAFSASHDLQEPLRNVAVYSQLLERRCSQQLDESSRQFLQFILDASQRMGALISDLLAYTQAAVSDYEPVPPTDANQILAQVLSGMRRSIEECHATVTHDSLPEVAMKPVHLEQLLQNLIGNAIKYRQDDIPPHVHISGACLGDEIRISVRDNGIGISPRFHDKIFGVFKRLHPKGGKYPGTGIGLAICQRIVERYGGKLSLESAVGEGSIFSFSIPAKPGGCE